MPIAVKLKRTNDEIVARFKTLETRSDVADLLEIPAGLLKYVLYFARERRQYKTFTIPKRRGGDRVISAPTKNIAILQRKLKRVFDLIHRPRECATAFTAGVSIVDNARPHLRKRWVLNFDIKDFFHSIHIGRIIGMLTSPPYGLGTEAAVVIAQIVCVDEGYLPQGGITSPILSNMVCTSLDADMLKLSKELKFTYTRYADDITVSSSTHEPHRAIANKNESGVWSLGPVTTDILAKYKFVANPEKTRVRMSNHRQRVTGVIVNSRLSSTREYIRHLRSLIHECETKNPRDVGLEHAKRRGFMLASDPGKWIARVIQGRLAYLSMIRGKDDSRVRFLTRRAKKLFGGQIPLPTPIEDLLPQSSLRRVGRSVDWERIVARYQRSVFQLKTTHGADESFASAFLAGAGYVLTAGHNVIAGDGSHRVLSIVNPIDGAIVASAVRAVYDERNAMDIAVLGKPTFDIANAPALFIQERLPQIGEEVAAFGYPHVSQRYPGLVLHIGRVEAVTRHYLGARYVSVSFASGPGLSGGPLVTADGCCIGVMCQNSFAFLESARKKDGDIPADRLPDPGDPESSSTATPPPVRVYGQAIAIEHWRSIPDVPPVRR